jgi:hypothetical protein
MTPLTTATDALGTEWRLRSVDLVLGPAPDLPTLFGALAAAATAANLVPHVVHCDEDRDGFRLVASCDTDTTGITMEGIVRILRGDAATATAA